MAGPPAIPGGGGPIPGAPTIIPGGFIPGGVDGCSDVAAMVQPGGASDDGCSGTVRPLSVGRPALPWSSLASAIAESARGVPMCGC